MTDIKNNMLLRGKEVDSEIIKMLEAYIELYNTLDFTKWGAYGEKTACRMCKLVGIDADYKTDCSKCPLYTDCGGHIPPCISEDNTGRMLEDLVLDINYGKYGEDISEDEQRKIIKARMKTLYKRLKANGYFD